MPSMPSKHSFDPAIEQEFLERLRNEMANAQTNRINIGMGEHVKKISEGMLANNPYVPPRGCPINSLPDELLEHIFEVGTLMKDEWEDQGEDEDEIEMDAIGSPQLLGDIGDDQDMEDATNAKTADDNDEDDDDDDENELQLHFQVLVSHVCKRWREIALQSSGLWTSIMFTEGPPFERSATWIERSKGLPLDLNIDCTDSAHELDEGDEDEEMVPHPLLSLEDLGTILDIAVPHIKRWRSLEVAVNVYEYAYAILERLELHAAPQLEVLQLYHYEENDQFDEFQPAALQRRISLFKGGAPKLSNVTLWGVHVDWLNAPYLSGLIDLELAYHAKNVRPSWENFRNMLQSSPDLHTFSLSLSGPAGIPADWPSETIELSSVKDLALSYLEASYIAALMQKLSFPNLQGLALDLDEEDYSEFAAQLTSPPPGKAASLLHGLTSFKLSGLPCNRQSIDLILEQLVNVESLNLNCAFVDEGFFDKLMDDRKGSPTKVFCPNLKAITTTGIDGHLMKHFVEFRKKAGYPIELVFMSEDDNVEKRDEDWLRKQVTFEYFEPSDSEDEVEDDDLEPEDDIMD